MRKVIPVLAATLIFSASWKSSQAEVREVTIRVENLSPTNSIAFAPLRVGFNNGTYDSFNVGQTASPAIVSIAEGGSGADWFPAFMAADPTAVLGTVVPTPAGPLTPGASASATFTIDTDVNPFFTFGSMVVPSNDYFIGNDSPTQYRLFDGDGNLLIQEINQFGRDIWETGSETTDAANAAFLMGGNNNSRTPENGVVRFDFADLAAFNGLTTAAGYNFALQISADSPIYRISITSVPEPASLGVCGFLGLLALGALRRRSAI